MLINVKTHRRLELKNLRQSAQMENGLHRLETVLYMYRILFQAKFGNRPLIVSKRSCIRYSTKIGNLLVTVVDNNENKSLTDFLFWNVSTGETWKLEGFKEVHWYRTIFSPNGKLLATMNFNNNVYLWDVAKRGESKGKPLAIGGYYSQIKFFSPDGTRLVMLGDGELQMWDVDTGKCLWRCDYKPPFEDPSPYSREIVSSPDGLCIALTNDKTVLLLDAVKGKIMKPLNGHEGIVYSLTFSHCGNFLASASIDNTVRLWDVKTGKTEHILYGNIAAPTLNIAWITPDQIVINSENNPLAIWKRLIIAEKPQWCPVHFSGGSVDLFCSRAYF